MFSISVLTSFAMRALKVSLWMQACPLREQRVVGYHRRLPFQRQALAVVAAAQRHYPQRIFFCVSHIRCRYFFLIFAFIFSISFASFVMVFSTERTMGRFVS